MFLLIMTHLINFVFSSCAKAISRESVSLSLYSPHYSAFNFNSFRRLVRSFLRFLLFLSFLKIVKSVSEHRNIKNRRNDIIHPRINSKIYFFPRVPSLEAHPSRSLKHFNSSFSSLEKNTEPKFQKKIQRDYYSRNVDRALVSLRPLLWKSGERSIHPNLYPHSLIADLVSFKSHRQRFTYPDTHRGEARVRGIIS